MKYTRSITCKVIDILCPLLIISVVFFTIFQGNRIFQGVRDGYANTLLDIIEIAASSDCPVGEAGLSSIVVYVMENLEDLDTKTIFIFDTDRNLLVSNADAPYQFDFDDAHPRLGYYIANYQEGNLQKNLGSSLHDIHFRWITSYYDYELLAIHILYIDTFGTTFLLTLGYIIILLVLIYAIKQLLFDRNLYMTVLNNSQDTLIKDFKYRKYDNNKE